jgi:AcrR family transcriptional regulator
MVGQTKKRNQLGSTPEDARIAVLRAAERCIGRHGIRKTTMDDIAKEAGISRPSIYRYFADREQLLIALTTEHSRALTTKARAFIAKQEDFQSALVEGILYLADHGRRDPFTRFLVSDEGGELGMHIRTDETIVSLTRDFWDPFLDDALARGLMRSDLPRDTVHSWLGNLGLMVMSLLDQRPERIASVREMLQIFVVPALMPVQIQATSPRSRKLTSR